MSEQVPLIAMVAFTIGAFSLGCLVGACHHAYFLNQESVDVVLTINNDMTVRHVVSPLSVNLAIKMADQEGTVRDLPKKPSLVTSTIETVQSATVGAKEKE